jgi:hypothetical protein
MDFDNSYVVMGSGGNYGHYAKLRGYMKDGQFAVIRYWSWLAWYNEARFSNSRLKIEDLLPKPESIHNTEKEAKRVSSELNSALKIDKAVTLN